MYAIEVYVIVRPLVVYCGIQERSRECYPQ